MPGVAPETARCLALDLDSFELGNAHEYRIFGLMNA
jgi:hypothetical protein